MKDNYKILLGKLDEFIRKYYKNLMIRGAIYTIALLVIFFLVAVIIEFFAQMDTIARTILFYVTLGLSIMVIWRLIMVPFLKIIRIGKIISYEQAAVIIGKHFSSVKDKLLNTLQLKELIDEESRDLVLASINQRIAELKPVPFKTAINIRSNLKYVKYVAPPLFIVIFLLVVTPRVVTEPARRIVNHSTYFEKEKPFELVLLNQNLTAFQQEDYELQVKIVGDEIPDLVYVKTGNNIFKLSKRGVDEYFYWFRNLQKNTVFSLVSGKYSTEQFEIKVLPKPVILNFDILPDYPDYTGKSDEIIENVGDITVPEGTTVKWRFYTRDTETLEFSLNEETQALTTDKSNTFIFEKQLFKSTFYSVKSANEYVKNSDSLFYSLTVIPDLYPTIWVEEIRDSVFDNRLYFQGNIKDDYGFSRLQFKYSVVDKSSDTESFDEIGVSRSLDQQQFFHFFDIASLAARPGDEIEYYFEVWDNDGINGSKSSKSQKMIFRVPTIDEIDEATDKSNDEIKDDLKDAMDEVKQLQNDIEDLSKKLVEKKEITWQDKQAVQNLLDRQEAIQNKIESIKQENIDKSRKENQYKEINEEIIEKQKQLEELFEKVMSDEMKDLFQEMQEMLEELNKDKMDELLEQMQLSSEEIEEQLDRSLELFKRLEFEKNMTETIEKLDKLAQEQEELSEETKEGKKDDSEELKKKQEKINEKFDKIKDELEQLQEQNQDLEEPNSMPETDQQEEEIQNEINESLQNLKDQKMGKASQSQKGASQKMKNLGSQLSEMLSNMQAQSLGEDIFALREILENLVQVSFDQEDLMEAVRVVKRGDPRYITYIQDQKKLKDDLEMIKDSLKAVAKRQPAIDPVVSQEIKEINTHIDLAIESLDNRRISGASTNQQFVMTSVNNLALLLAEAMEQMQQEMMSMQAGGACENKAMGAGQSPSISTLRQLQEQLNRQMEQMKKGMNQKGEGMPIPGQQSMSEQLARMAAQQEAVRQQMQQYLEQLKGEGVGIDGETRKMIEDMERTETDLVNKMITDQTLMRQKEILTRLLEAEKAERERKQEEKRESKEAKSKKISNPEEFFEYKSINLKQVELLKTIPPTLKPYYKQKVNQYLFNFGGDKL